MGTSPHFARHWFTARGWKPFVFQKQVWAAIKNGQSGLLHASTGAGKTYAVWLGALDRFARKVSSQVLFLHQGLVEEEGAPDDVLGNPKSERLKQFLSGNLK